MKTRSTDYHLHHMLEALFRPSWEDSISPPCICNGIAGFKGKIVKLSCTHHQTLTSGSLPHTFAFLDFGLFRGVDSLSPGF